MMNESVQHGCAQGAMPDFEALMKLTEDREKEQTREHEFMKKREIQLWHDRRDAQRTRRIVRDQLIRRWARRKTKEQTREHEFMKKREIQLWHDRRDAQRTRRIVRDQLIRRWARRKTIDNSCRVLSLYNLRF